jgi:hypothetical protein
MQLKNTVLSFQYGKEVLPSLPLTLFKRGIKIQISENTLYDMTLSEIEHPGNERIQSCS